MSKVGLFSRPSNGLSDAYHSTETAVRKVLSDILLAVDSGDLAVLTLLDLSAAFDTVDHGIFLHRLKVSIIRPEWFSPPLVHILPARSSPARPMWVNQVSTETRALRRNTRVGPRADPVLALHGGLDTAD